MNNTSINPPLNLLDEALGFLDHGEETGKTNHYKKSGSVILIQDCVETSGAFVLHHLIKRSLSPRSTSDDAVIFVAFANPFPHYDRILRKMGCNLLAQGSSKRFLFFDMLMLACPDRDGKQTIEDLLLALYGRIQQVVEACSSAEGNRNITIMIDDVSLIEVAANGSSNLVLNFLHYCYRLVTEFGCSFAILNHEDVYLDTDSTTLLLQMEYLADVVIKAEPLSTGLAADIHGQLTVINKGTCGGFARGRSKVRNFQFKVKESTIEYFYPGGRT